MSLLRCHALRSIVRFTNREATHPDHGIDELRTRFLAMSRAAAWRHVQACIEGLGRGWRIEEETPASGQFRLARTTPLRWFTSDVTVWLWPADERRVGVDIVSASRIGRVDFGQNARNIRDFYRALEAYLQRVPENGDSGIRPRGSQRAGGESSAALDQAGGQKAECGIRTAESKNPGPGAS